MERFQPRPPFLGHRAREPTLHLRELLGPAPAQELRPGIVPTHPRGFVFRLPPGEGGVSKDLRRKQAIHGRGIPVLSKVELERLRVKVRTQAVNV